MISWLMDDDNNLLLQPYTDLKLKYIATEMDSKNI